MHNLLSKNAKKDLMREYIGRLLVVGFALGTCVALLGLAALMPAFIATRFEIRYEQSEKERLTALLEKEEAGEKPLEQLERGRNVLALLDAQAEEERYSSILNEAFDMRPPGITISSIVFNRVEHTYVIQGLAQDRDALVGFSRRLESSPRFAHINLPISDLARSTDLTFRLTLVLALRKQ